MRRCDVIVDGDTHHEVHSILQRLVELAAAEPAPEPGERDGELRQLGVRAAFWQDRLPAEHTHRYVPFMSQVHGSIVWERRLLAEPRYPVICDACQDVQWHNKIELVGFGIICNLWCDEWSLETRERVNAMIRPETEPADPTHAKEPPPGP